ncbi:hypothetical protein D8674_036713 [Pyrus ussuriensis x Pyrus communis]|uniref:AAA ATPase AAA+ lid domain-containing protein n=1 Tax=Pyrus ussuriensis x Pyrus communis TaxID=2448454 RepID=A0A5N5I6Y6_9ROSA|nr:hypothetical protein D8674_036713 [Pyrus ussuriensis x Pyrus communis]
MDGVDLKKVEEKMNSASGAELKAVCTEAGMFALRERRVHVTQEDFEIAVGKVMMEVTKKNMSSCKMYKYQLGKVAGKSKVEQDQVLSSGFGGRTSLKPVQSHSSSRSGPLSAHHRHSAAHPGPSSARPGPSSARPGLQADLLGLSLPPSGH